MTCALAIGALVVGCAKGTPAPVAAAVPVNPLYVAPSAYDFSDNTRLLERIVEAPHGYFRFINKKFATETCRRVEAMASRPPLVNLHGDAHLEQYAVTDLGRGLTDFDDSTSGPAIVDLLRFAVSLRLTCQARDWGADADGLIRRFLAGYRVALVDPDVEATPPKVAARIRDAFEYDRGKYFEWIARITVPVDEAQSKALEQAMTSYVEMMCSQDSELSPDYFKVRSIGSLQMGIGSALDRKFLIRVEGQTPAPEDDVVLEVKEVRNLSGISCITHNAEVDPFRILVGQSRIAYNPYKLLGYLRFEGRVFWIHSWVDNYREVKIGDSFASVEELSEVVYDVGVQLGRGHPARIAAPLGQQLRFAQVQMLDAHTEDIVRVSLRLTEQTVAAWRRFQREAAAEGLTGADGAGHQDEQQP